jgi:hypothetical protein
LVTFQILQFLAFDTVGALGPRTVLATENLSPKLDLPLGSSGRFFGAPLFKKDIDGSV